MPTAGPKARGVACLPGESALAVSPVFPPVTLILQTVSTILASVAHVLETVPASTVVTTVEHVLTPVPLIFAPVTAVLASVAPVFEAVAPERAVLGMVVRGHCLARRARSVGPLRARVHRPRHREQGSKQYGL